MTLIDGIVSPVKAFADWNMREPVYEVVTETGKRIVRNAQHPLFVAIKWSRDGAHPIVDVKEWQGVARLQQWLSSPPEYKPSKFMPDDWCVETERKHAVLCAMPIEVPVFGDVAMQEHEIKLLAYLIGDGGLSGASPVFSQQENKQLQEVREAAAKMGCILIQKNRYDYVIARPKGGSTYA
ncbi:MAG: hypothetical protein F6K00_19560 [Leptolyngbya sp. SIOISBB]|nr:hypothetical protein [Leptolyngbya sp. SIOISBB]